MKSILLSLILHVAKGWTLGTRGVLHMGVGIFLTLSILSVHAPKIFSSTERGLGLGMGVGLVGGAGEPVDEASSDSSCACKNTFSNENLLELVSQKVPILKVFDTKPPTEASLRAMAKAIPGPRGRKLQVPDLSNGPGNGNGKGNGKGKTIPLCRALSLAGYGKWSLTDLDKIDMALLRDVDYNARKLSGRSVLTHRDIMSCNPKYFPGLETQETPKETETSYICTKVRSCHWASFERAIKAAAAAHAAVGGTESVDYLVGRALIEVRKLANRYQSRPGKEWRTFLSAGQESSPQGFLVEGTSFYVSWDLFKTHERCLVS